MPNPGPYFLATMYPVEGEGCYKFDEEGIEKAKLILEKGEESVPPEERLAPPPPPPALDLPTPPQPLTPPPPPPEEEEEEEEEEEAAATASAAAAAESSPVSDKKYVPKRGDYVVVRKKSDETYKVIEKTDNGNWRIENIIFPYDVIDVPADNLVKVDLVITGKKITPNLEKLYGNYKRMPQEGPDYDIYQKLNDLPNPHKLVNKESNSGGWRWYLMDSNNTKWAHSRKNWDLKSGQTEWKVRDDTNKFILNTVEFILSPLPRLSIEGGNGNRTKRKSRKPKNTYKKKVINRKKVKTLRKKKRR